ncbi:hypothetical protein EJB05_02463 [Eragrostis curvula]|uniref:RNase H type-1 domain-containing protein n=1 Tax=Eragrostis curvula TaxID=38414 RepID=A0A5J9WSF8_9POAL|nr:hypothetical protein EJB05_02463 [Eragrostis curvula]
MWGRCGSGDENSMVVDHFALLLIIDMYPRTTGDHIAAYNSNFYHVSYLHMSAIIFLTTFSACNDYGHRRLKASYSEVTIIFCLFSALRLRNITPALTMNLHEVATKIYPVNIDESTVLLAAESLKGDSPNAAWRGSVIFLTSYMDSLIQIRQQVSVLTAKGKQGRSQSERQREGHQLQHWVPPECGVLKINVDGAYHAHSGRASLGVIFRDDCGRALLVAWRLRDGRMLHL